MEKSMAKRKIFSRKSALRRAAAAGTAKAETAAEEEGDAISADPRTAAAVLKITITKREISPKLNDRCHTESMGRCTYTR